MEKIIAIMQQHADDGNVELLGYTIALNARYYPVNRLDMQKARTFTLRKGRNKYVVNIPEEIDHYDLVAAIVAHGGEYFPKKTFMKGKVHTTQARLLLMGGVRP